MFSQKKRNFTWIYVCAVLIIAIFAVIILIGALTNRGEEEALKANLESRVDENAVSVPSQEPQEGEPQGTEPQDSEPSEEGSSTETEDDTEKDDSKQFYQSYYLVKYDSNVIKIYFSDESGNLVQLEETGIVYETLSPQDQQRFVKGIKAGDRDELNRLIMNYES